MTLLRRIIAFIGLLTLVSPGFAAYRVCDFALLDQTGKFYQLS